MGRGNPGYRFQNRPYDHKKPGHEYDFPNTYFTVYSTGEWTEPWAYGEDFENTIDYIAHASGLENNFGIRGKRYSECCIGFKDEATEIASGKYCSLMAMDGDNDRIAFSIVPNRLYDDFVADVEYNNEQRSRPLEDEALNNHIKLAWEGFILLYQMEAEKAGENIHKALPAEGAITKRSGAWCSAQVSAYDPEINVITFL